MPADRSAKTAELLRSLAAMSYDDRDDFRFAVASALVEAVLVEHTSRGDDLESIFTVLSEGKALRNKKRAVVEQHVEQPPSPALASVPRSR